MNLVCPRCHSMVQDKDEYNRCNKCGALVSSRLPVKHEPISGAVAVERYQEDRPKGRKKKELPTEEEMVGCKKG